MFCSPHVCYHLLLSPFFHSASTSRLHPLLALLVLHVLTTVLVCVVSIPRNWLSSIHPSVRSALGLLPPQPPSQVAVVRPVGNPSIFPPSCRVLLCTVCPFLLQTSASKTFRRPRVRNPFPPFATCTSWQSSSPCYRSGGSASVFCSGVVARAIVPKYWAFSHHLQSNGKLTEGLDSFDSIAASTRGFTSSPRMSTLGT